MHRELKKLRHTRSEWSNANSSYYKASDAGTVKTQLEGITQELEEEQKKSEKVIGKQIEELEEVKTRRDDNSAQQKKMLARMGEL